MIDELADMMRRIAHEVVAAQHQPKATLVTTAYDPKTHSVKGMLMPHGVESGWIPIASAHVGNGFGMLIGPKVGDAQKLDGDQFDVDFDLGNPDTGLARHKLFSTQDKPPEVQSGEMLMRHENGTRIFINKDGELAMQFGQSGGQLTFTKDNVVTIDNSGQRIVVKGSKIDFNPTA